MGFKNVPLVRIDLSVGRTPLRMRLGFVAWREVALAVCTLLFATTQTWLGWVVAANGVACHGCMALRLPIAHRVRLFDVACNACMVVYVNACAQAQPHALVLTALAVCAWRWNQRNADAFKSVVHAGLVQLPLFLALCQFSRPGDGELVP